MNLASTDYQEKRNFIRMRVETPVAIKSASNEVIKGMCHNLSGGGMLVSLPQALKAGDKLEITVSSTHSHRPILKALTKVCRVDSGTEKVHRHGLKIEEMID